MEHVRIPSARRLAGLGLAGAVAVAAVTVTASPAIAEAPVLGAGKPNAIPGAYIVVLKDKAPGRPADLAAQHGVKIKHTYSHALRGFSADMSEQAASRLAANPAVAFVEQDAKVSLEAIQPNPPSWGLDRSDQRDLPLDNTYGYPDSGGAGVTAYIIDTGIRTTHADFGAGRCGAPTPPGTAPTPTVMGMARTLPAPSAEPRTGWPRGRDWSR